MPAYPPDDENEAAGTSPTPGRSRRAGLTPEQRRLLGTPRSLETSVAPVSSPPPDVAPASIAAERERIPKDDNRDVDLPASEPAVAKSKEERKRSIDLTAQTKASRALELRHAILVLGLIAFLGMIFWAGRKFDRVKYMIVSRLNAKELDAHQNKFPDMSFEDLISTALAAEKRGDWRDAAERFIAAKRKNLVVPGILFRVGKLCFDHGDLNGADNAFDHAIRFGENLPVANYHRGLIAVRRHDLPAATRYFEAAANAEPFVADFYYFWAEALRIDQHPREAIRRYEQAVQRTPSTTDATLCQFKIRLARIEAAEAAALTAEVEEKRKAGPLPVDWLMTDAALQLHAGKIQEAADLISEARSAGLSGLFMTCAGDTIFLKAAEAHPEIAATIRTAPPPQVEAPSANP